MALSLTTSTKAATRRRTPKFLLSETDTKPYHALDAPNAMGVLGSYELAFRLGPSDLYDSFYRYVFGRGHSGTAVVVGLYIGSGVGRDHRQFFERGHSSSSARRVHSLSEFALPILYDANQSL